MSETATQLSGIAGLDAAAPARSRKAWQTPKIIKGKTQSLASAENDYWFDEDGAPATNSPPS